MRVGKNNKARRAAKSKARRTGARQRPGRGAGRGDSPLGDPFGSFPDDEIGGPRNDPFSGPFGRSGGGPTAPPPSRSGPRVRWEHLEAAAHRKDDVELQRLAERMVRDDPVTGPRDAEQILATYLDRLWRAGWQPAEVARQVRRKTTKTAAQVVEIAIHADHARRPGQEIDLRWSQQVAELGGRTVSTRPGWLALWMASQRHHEVWVAVQVAGALSVLGHLPIVDTLIPPPGSSGSSERSPVRGMPRQTGAEDPVLRRVRKLLAKAESTTYVDEADSLTAKAHQLMTAHAIDQAVLHETEPGDVPRTIRVPIDAPYADAKALLLQVVAAAHRCRALVLTGLDLSSVVGHAGDLRAVELIFTSLLVQAQRALDATGGGARGRTRSVSYRSSFYLSYAGRIGERLSEAADEVFAEAGEGAHLPVLRAREEAVDDAFEEWFGRSVTSRAVRGGLDAAGHAHGRQAADTARLGSAAIAK